VSWRCWRRGVFQHLMEMFWVVVCCEEKKRVVQHLAHTLEPDGSDSEDATCAALHGLYAASSS